MPMDRQLAERFARMSPYLFRDLLRGHARLTRGPDTPLLDATDEAPNWQQRDAQLAWHVLGLYCDYVYGVVGDQGNVRLRPPGAPVDHEAAFNRFAEGLMDLREGLAIGTDFLAELWPYVAQRLLPGLTESQVIAAFTRAMSAGPYSSPPTLEFVGPLLLRYLTPRLFEGDADLADQCEVVATAGTSAALGQFAQALVANRLLEPGDRIGLLLPAAQPLAELFARQLGLEIVGLPTAAASGYCPTGETLELLADPRVKLLVFSSPGDPVPVIMSAEALDLLDPVVRARRDLLVLADYAGANLVDQPLPSALVRWPRQTYATYSFAQDFGLAGARLGVLVGPRESVADQVLQQRPAEVRQGVERRYEGRLPHPAASSFMARLVQESAGLAYGHRGGLATSDQVLLCLCAAYDAVAGPVSQTFYGWVRQELLRRHQALYQGLGLRPPDAGPAVAACHLALVDLEEVAAASGVQFALGLQREDLWTCLLHLAHSAGLILLPAVASGAGLWSVRLALASLSEAECLHLGQTLAAEVRSFAAGEACTECGRLAL